MGQTARGPPPAAPRPRGLRGRRNRRAKSGCPADQSAPAQHATQPAQSSSRGSAARPGRLGSRALARAL
eukprot:789217-Pyramimonas_sp.AAC.1